MSKKLGILLLLIGISTLLYCQIPSGTPFIKNYLPSEYKSASDNWCIVQDKRNLIYVANTNALMEFDGKNWSYYSNDNKSIFRSIAVSDSNIIYTGSVGEIGYLKPINGKLKYVSLNTLLKQNSTFGDVWKTYCVGNKVYFQTNTQLFVYNGSAVTEILPEKGKSFHFSYKVNSDIYVLEIGSGIKKLIGNKLELIKGGELFKNEKLYCLLNSENDKLIAGTKESGLFKISSNGEVEKFKTEIDTKLIEGFLYCGISTSKDNIALGTIYNGLYIINLEGKLVQHLNKKSGLPDQLVKNIFLDNQDGLWLALDKGISRIEINSPITFFGEQDGLPGRIDEVCEFNNYIYVSSSKGVSYYKIDDNSTKKFLPIDAINSPAWSFEVIEGLNIVLVSTQQGVFELKENKAKLIYSYHAYCTKFIGEQNKLFIGLKDGLILFEYTKGKWNNEKYFDSIPYEIRKIDVDDKGIVWIGTAFDGIIALTDVKNNSVYFLDKNKLSTTNNNYQIYYFNKKNNLSNLSFIRPYNTSLGMFFSTLGEVMEYDFRNDNFFKSTKFPKEILEGDVQLLPIVEDKNGIIWISIYNELKSKIYRFNPQNSEKSNYISRLENQSIYGIHISNKKYTLLSSLDGIFCYNQSQKLSSATKVNTLIRFVSAGNDTLYEGFPGNNFLYNKNILYKNNDLTFVFALPSFDNSDKNQYSFYLEGLEETWKPFSEEIKIQYLKLREGTYTFHVRSKNIYGRIGKEATFKFTINPPWHRTTIAYLIYFSFLVVVVFIIVKISVYRLKKAKSRLEKIVKERTQEISRQKEIVEHQKVLVELKNKDITDSIQYAKRIQEAILPLQEEIETNFVKSFIFYKPRDIVSGDFYWYSKVNETESFIAVVDCTGHGVPGAFMSMIGHTLLNEIVNEKKIYQPNLILNELHESVRLALKQNYHFAESRDGMDMALIKIDKAKNQIEYAGANRALYIISNDKLEEIKPDKMPIGGLQLEVNEVRKFTLKILKIENPSWIYAFTDGFPDQFGGPLGKKFMVKKLKETLQEISSLPAIQQKETLNTTLNNWMQEHEQVDDILLIGVFVSCN
ncbi:MAG: SpoIIE family protein phosphatase [Bacteroidota bacterium]